MNSESLVAKVKSMRITLHVKISTHTVLANIDLMENRLQMADYDRKVGEAKVNLRKAMNEWYQAMNICYPNSSDVEISIEEQF
jgi:hypothetical protein